MIFAKPISLKIFLISLAVSSLFLLSFFLAPSYKNVNALEGNLLINSSFENGSGGISTEDKDPKGWATTEGITVRGTARHQEEKPALVQTLCDNEITDSVVPLDGRCVLKIISDVGVKAQVAQSFSKAVIDGKFESTIGIFIPNVSQNKYYHQQLELRSGRVPGAAGDIIRIGMSSKNFTVSNTIGIDKNFAPLAKNKWNKIKITMTKISDNKNTPNKDQWTSWSLKVENLSDGKVYWDSMSKDPQIKIVEIPRERILPQIGSIFFGDECLGSSTVASGCDGVGVFYYDALSVENPDGTGRNPDEIVLPGDANKDGLLTREDFEIWKRNYLNALFGRSAVFFTNENGDFKYQKESPAIDGADFATWWNRLGQVVQN